MADLGLIVGDAALPTPGDTALNTLLLTEHSVTMHSDTDSVPDSKNGFVLSESCTPADLGSKYIGLSVPLLVLEVGYWDELGMTNINNSNVGAQTIGLLHPHEITNGVTIPLANAGSLFGPPIGNVANSGTIFFTDNIEVNALGFAFEIHSILFSGMTLARMVGISIINNAAADLTASGELIILNAITWMLTVAPVNQFTSISAFSIARRVYAKRAGIT